MDIYQKIDIVLISAASLCLFLTILKSITILVMYLKKKHTKRKCERIRLGNRIETEVITLIEVSAPLFAMLIYKWICWGHA